MNKKKKGDLVFKFDLEKAYDRAKWGFQTSIMFGFLSIIISLIMHNLFHSDFSFMEW